MNKRICFYMPPFPRVRSYYDMIDEAVRHGLSSVEGFCHFELVVPDKAEAFKIRNYADKNGVSFPCFSVFTDLVGEKRDEEIKKLLGFAEVAAILGAPYLHHTVISEFSEPEKVLSFREEYFSRGIAAVRKVYDYSDSIGVKTVYEDQGYILNGVEGFGRFLREVDRDIGVVADFGNIYQSGNNITDFISAFAEKIVHAHVKDIVLKNQNDDGTGLKTLDGRYMFETRVGEGQADMIGAFKMLRSCGYNGAFGLEYGAADDASDSIRKALEFIDENI